MKSTQLIMGMPITVELVGLGDARDQELRKRVFTWFSDVDARYSTYKPNSIISRIASDTLDEKDAPGEVQGVLAACRSMNRDTQGYFDVWHKGQLDPSGYVKGWSIAKAAAILDEGDAVNYVIEAGGDIQVKGKNRDGQPWRVGIRNPFDRKEVIKVLHMTEGAVATSGNYERGRHIYDPHSGKRADEIASISVVGPDICRADVYATAAFAMGKAGAEWITGQGLDVYMVARDGTATLSPGITRLTQ